jgi:hypothetical protein
LTIFMTASKASTTDGDSVKDQLPVFIQFGLPDVSVCV